MNLTTITRINLKKLKVQRAKALFLIIPVFFLFTVVIIATSQLSNFKSAIDETIFNTLANQATLVQVQKNLGDFGIKMGGPQKSFQETNFDNNFSENDLAVVKSIPGVEAASLNTNIPISNIVTNDLFENTAMKINSLSELDSVSAKLFTSDDFEFVEGEPIPIILGAGSFYTSYEDWGGKTEISLDFQSMRIQPGEDIQKLENNSPIKTKAIEYKKEDLIGKTITLQFGGLDAIQTYKISNNNGSRVFTKLTEDEINTKIADRKSAISTYWNYDKISAPITYQFKVVGVASSSANNYVPSEFANKVMKDYVQNQLDSIVVEPSVDLLDKTFLGISFDGTEVSNSIGAGFFREIRRDGGQAQGFMIGGPNEQNTVSYTIPGLVIKTSTDGNNTVEGIHKDTNFYASSLKSSQLMTIKTTSVYERSNVIAKMNESGIAVSDTNDFDVFAQIQSTINSISLLLGVGFIVLISAIVLITMMKFVSDSRKEIGIFRAMGMRRRTVLIMFVSQSLLYTFFAYILGLMFGLIINTLLAFPIKNAFQSFISQTIQKTFNITPAISEGAFTSLNLNLIMVYSLALLTIAFLVTIIPAYQASKVSPVEAIKGE